MQPNSGAQGEYAGLLTIAAYHRAEGQGQRNICLIPVSAHGTNPASAVKSAGVTVEDVAKRLIDCGFHAPTMSWPVAGTLMIEPTESETKAELDRFCDAMLAIRDEIAAIEAGDMPRENNPLKNAPHTVEDLVVEWGDRPYTREQGCFPPGAFRVDKYWPPVNRVDNVHGDRNLICTCPPLEDYAEAAE